MWNGIKASIMLYLLKSNGGKNSSCDVVNQYNGMIVTGNVKEYFSGAQGLHSQKTPGIIFLDDNTVMNNMTAENACDLAIHEMTHDYQHRLNYIDGGNQYSESLLNINIVNRLTANQKLLLHSSIAKVINEYDNVASHTLMTKPFAEKFQIAQIALCKHILLNYHDISPETAEGYDNILDLKKNIIDKLPAAQQSSFYTELEAYMSQHYGSEFICAFQESLASCLLSNNMNVDTCTSSLMPDSHFPPIMDNKYKIKQWKQGSIQTGKEFVDTVTRRQN